MILEIDEKEKNETDNDENNSSDAKNKKDEEQGGPKGLEPTRYGDWEKNGRCVDF